MTASQKTKIIMYLTEQGFQNAYIHANEIEKMLTAKLRTFRQNRYLHVIIALYAIELGYTLEEMKTILKRDCSFMIYEKAGNKFLRSSTTLDTKEMTDFIEYIRNHAGQNGLYLPSADDYRGNMEELEKTVERCRTYL